MSISTSDRNALRETIFRAGEAAADALMARWGAANPVEYKGDVNPVTEADREAEAVIAREVRSRFPRHAILAEESGTSSQADSPWRWLVDPLDGTVNFTHGLPVFSLSIAVEHEGRMEMGLVRAPAMGETYFAERGAGAHCNGRRIAVSETRDMIRALAATGFPYDRQSRSAYYLKFVNLALQRAQGLRRMGSASIDLCYVAAGRFDVYWEEQLWPWDMAAGALILREAGGVATGFEGGDDFLESGRIAAANPHLHPRLLEMIREARRLPPGDEPHHP